MKGKTECDLRIWRKSTLLAVAICCLVCLFWQIQGTVNAEETSTEDTVQSETDKNDTESDSTGFTMRNGISLYTSGSVRSTASVETDAEAQETQSLMTEETTTGNASYLAVLAESRSEYSVRTAVIAASGDEVEEAEASADEAELPEETEAEEVELDEELLHEGFVMTTVVDDDYLYIREEPDASSEYVGKLYAGAVGEILEAGEEWTYISSGDVTGWVNNEFIITGEEAWELARSEYCICKATILADGLKVREEPSLEGTVITVVYQNERYEVLEQGEEWFLIEYADGEEGYIFAEFVEVDLIFTYAVSRETEEAEAAAAAAAEAAAKAAAVTTATTAATKTSTSSSSGTTSTSSSSSTTSTSSVSVSATENEIYVMACMLQVEAGGSYEGMVAVANCILNRVKSSLFPNTITEVIYQSGQFATGSTFESYLASGPSSSALQAAQAAVNGYNNLGSYLYFRSAATATYSSYSSYVNIGGNVFYAK